MVTAGPSGFKRNIHDISNAPFRTKFEDELPKARGATWASGIISDYEDQPLVIGSHHGVYALATVGRMNNLDELARGALANRGTHLSEVKGDEYNPTEVVATLINQEDTIPRRHPVGAAGHSGLVLAAAAHGPDAHLCRPRSAGPDAGRASAARTAPSP